MSVGLVVIIVVLMLNVPTLLGASPVPVTKDTVGMVLMYYCMVIAIIHILKKLFC